MKFIMTEREFNSSLTSQVIFLEALKFALPGEVTEIAEQIQHMNFDSMIGVIDEMNTNAEGSGVVFSIETKGKKRFLAVDVEEEHIVRKNEQMAEVAKIWAPMLPALVTAGKALSALVPGFKACMKATDALIGKRAAKPKSAAKEAAEAVKKAAMAD